VMAKKDSGFKAIQKKGSADKGVKIKTSTTKEKPSNKKEKC